MANLTPLHTEKNGHWSRKTLDFLHSSIVDKVANVARVSEADEDDVTPCRIVVNGINIHDLLLEQDLATTNKDASNATNNYKPNDSLRMQNIVLCRRTKEKSDDISSFLTSFEDITFAAKDNGNSVNKSVSSSVREPAKNYDQYKALFAAIEKPSLEAVHKSSVDEDPEEEFCAAQSIVEAAFTELDDSCSDDVNEPSDVIQIKFDPNDAPSDSSTFDPFGASTPASSVSSVSLKHWSLQYPFTNFKIIRLKDTSYKAKPVVVVNSLHLWLAPEKTQYETVLNKMSRFLNQKNIPPPACVPKHLIQPGLLCLAIYKEDSMYYRAMVKKYDNVLNEVTIVFIDYMNMEIVAANAIRVCPQKVAKIRLPNVLVKIHGLKRNSRWTDSKVAQRLIQALQDATLPIQVVVVKPAIDDKLAEVELHDKQGLVYRDMIAESYYNAI